MAGKSKAEKKYYFDEKAAQRPINFIERYCTHTQGKWMGQLIKLLPYQHKFISDVFGTKRTEDGLRRYQYAYLEIPKKNGKSTLLAALGLYLLGFDGVNGAEVIVVAGDKDQARIVHNSAKQMVMNNAALTKVFDVYVDAIHHRATNSVFRVTSADAPTKHGFNVSAVIFDELHVQKNDELWDILTKNVAAREEPLVFALTTAGYKNTFAHDISESAWRIKMGLEKSEFWYVMAYGIRDERRAMKEYNKEALWKEANPGYGVTVSKQYFKAQMEEIKKRPSGLSAFLRLHLNVWTGVSKGWDILPYLAECPQNIVEEKDLAGRVCYGGLDLARVGDTSAAVWLFPYGDGEDVTFDVLVRVWVPEDTLQMRVKEENVNWRHWQEQGLIKTTPGNVVDYEVIRRDLLADCKKFELAKPVGIYTDPWGAWSLVGKMQEEGVDIFTLPQRPANLCPAFSYLEKIIVSARLNYMGNPVFEWQAGNVQIVELQHDNRMPSKKDSKSRIDIISALQMAFAAYLSNVTQVNEKPERSIYDDWEEEE